MAETVRVVRKTTRYHWPDVQLNFWLIVFLAASATTLGVFAYFITVQQQMSLNSPWYMPFWVATGSLGILFVVLIIYLVSTRQLIPGIVILGSFILFVLFLTGLVKISIELFGPQGSVSTNCALIDPPPREPSEASLAYLQNLNVCEFDNKIKQSRVGHPF
ncbi:MAG: hypothetical protein M1825_004921 [Sarcosagium campestre]|nr:MAG: hypothetical protein M1825_004921 [Sarcosagium campestre]